MELGVHYSFSRKEEEEPDNNPDMETEQTKAEAFPMWRRKRQQRRTIQGRFSGCLLGGAAGDALGAPVEFMRRTEIIARFGPKGITNYAPAYGGLGTITDDTQMALFTAEGLLRAIVRHAFKGISHMPGVVAHAYLRWLLTQGERPAKKIDGIGDGWLFQQSELHSRRAPGNTCLSALKAMQSFGDPAHNDSKGCGGVMRMAPAGLMFWSAKGCGVQEAFRLGIELSALTHGHPTGTLTGGVLAVLILALIDGASLQEGLVTAKALLKQEARHEEALRAIETAEEFARSDVAPHEAIAKLGQGWVAEEALAISIYCALIARTFRQGVILAVNHDGDSDSTGAITGNLLGVMYGEKAIPVEWLEPLELREVIAEIAEDLYAWRDWKIGELSKNTELNERIWQKYPGW
jgi:ADP-ribosylglycohydrolase